MEKIILISNIGNRDINYNGKTLDRNSIRQESEKILHNYDSEKKNLSYQIIKPFLEAFADKLKNIYLFVTNQEDERVRNSDTLYIGEIIKKWIDETYDINVNVVQYTNNPTDYELVYNFFTSYFTQERNIFDKADKRIISLSGGTPQMNGALYVILSSIYPINNEFYSVFDEKLIPVNHEKTINRIFIKKSCIELLKINEYQSIIEILNSYNIKDQDSLISLLKYAHHRKNFDFEIAHKYLRSFLNSIPSSDYIKYQPLNLNQLSNPLNLIKEIFWKIEICHKNQNYLVLVALLFRLEEAILFEINNYFFKDNIKGSLTNKKNHPALIKYLEDNELTLWNSLQNITFKKDPLNINPTILNRTILFYIAKLKLDDLKKQNKDVFQIRNILDILDKINKYCYDDLKEAEREKIYGDKTSIKCLGDLRNSSLIAHGFEPVSKEKIENLYSEVLDQLVKKLRIHLKNLLDLLLNSKTSLENLFNDINNKILSFILKL